MHKLQVLPFCLLIALTASGQASNIHFAISGLNSPYVMVGYFFGGKAYKLDSIGTQGKETFDFRKESLNPGLYFCADVHGKLLDFIVPANPFSCNISGNMARPDSFYSKDSPENEAYFRFEQNRKSLENRIDTKKTVLNMMAKASKNDSSLVIPVQKDLDALFLEMDSMVMDYVQQHPDHLYARMLRAAHPADPPAGIPQLLKNGAENPAFIAWQSNHYWDNTDFREEVLLRNNFWQVYFDNFYARFVASQADSIIRATDQILAKMPRNGAFYRFTVMRIAQYYEMNDIPGSDRIFVHIADKYLAKDNTPWLDQATLERIAYRADVNRSNLTGSMAVNFTMQDETGKDVELYQIKAPLTLLIFYSPLCSHCMELMPKIYQTWLDFSPTGIAALAITTDEQVDYWKKFVNQQNWQWYDVCNTKVMEQLDKQYNVSNLPLIYLLDKNKIILAKRVKPSELGDVMAGYLNKGGH